MLEDMEIIELFWSRQERAVSELAEKYGNYCKTVAGNILGNSLDTEECVNDGYFAVWNSIPPQKPKSLGAYTAKIVRNKALDLHTRKSALKRGKGESALPIEELSDLVSGSDTEQELDKKELLAAINGFLASLNKRTRQIFVGRYWSCLSLSELAEQFQTNEHNLNVILSRTRHKLKKYLSERGFEL
ncbi:MAG: sigma-70 family RNA polymerase sigma factor [Firmicutes bacterium]|nr:sigma-70 family RNA polymerase sigma factor [[Eubacterium] siraeum]MCM1488270.1 sigma-70 family RNA polymerase sigma factor [Bacillota bacterium]